MPAQTLVAIRSTPYIPPMARVSGADIGRVFEFIRTAPAGNREDPLPSGLLAALRKLIPADAAAYFEIRRGPRRPEDRVVAGRAVLGYANSDDVEWAPGHEGALTAVRGQNPLTWDRWRSADGAVRLSTVIGRRELERLGYYQSIMLRNRIRDTLKVWLTATPDSVACVALERCDSEFTPRDQDVLGVLQHHLSAFREQALSTKLPPTVDNLWLTAREAEVLTWAARGMSDHEVAQVLGTSPRTVDKHLEHAYEKLGVHSRAEALALLTRSRPPH